MPYPGYNMNNYNSLSLSLAAMALGASLSGLALAVLSENPQPMIVAALSGLAVLLSSLSGVLQHIEQRRQIDGLRRTLEFSEQDRDAWQKQAEHEKAIREMADAHKHDNAQDMAERRISELNVKIDALEIAIQRLIMQENR
jgi:hypothetical protein